MLLLRAREQDVAAARQTEQLAQQAQEVAERRLLRVAESEERRGDLAMTRLRYGDAAESYAVAASFLPPSLSDHHSFLLSQQAAALFRQGDELGDNAALRQAIKMYGDALTERTRERVPLDWAMTQNNLGNALRTLGERQSGTARLEEAIATWEACLIVGASVWPPDWVQYVRDHRDEAQSEIKRRSAK